MAVTDYNKKKNLEVTSQNDSGATINKAQPVLVVGESTATFTDSFDVSGQDGSPDGVSFNSDGTKMFVVGEGNSRVYEYNLSTAFDVSTASFTDSFDVSGQDNTPTGMAFNSDGTKMFVVGEGNSRVYEYNLSTAFDVSTASFTDSFDVSGNPEGVTFNSDGTKMFVVENINENVYEYSLSTAFDVSTASFTDSFDVSGQDGSPEGVTFNSDGTKMFVVGFDNNNVYEYSLSTAFDVSTASFTDSFDVSGQDKTSTGVTFNSDGTKMFVVGSRNENVYEYSLGTGFDLNVTDSTSGTGDIVLDWTNISAKSDIAVYDQNGNLLGYEIESFDATAETAVLWVYGSWIRDDTVQAQVVYGDGPASSEEGSAADVWGNTGQNAVVVQHFQDDGTGSLDLLDSTSNNNDGTSGGESLIDAEFDGGADYNGADDGTTLPSSMFSSSGTVTVSTWINPDTMTDGGYGWTLRNNKLFLIEMGQSNSNGQLGIWDGSTHYDVTSLTAGNWYHVVVEQSDNGDVVVYVDGVKEFDQNIGFQTSDRGNAIGANVDSGGSAFGGRYDGQEDEWKAFSEGKGQAWTQAEYDASPKSRQVFFTQQAAEDTTQVTENQITADGDIAVKATDNTVSASGDIVIESQLDTQVAGDIALKSNDNTVSASGDILISSGDTIEFAGDIALKSFDNEKAVAGDIVLEDERLKVQAQGDIALKGSKTVTSDGDIALKSLDNTASASGDIVIETQFDFQVAGDIALQETGKTVSASGDIVLVDQNQVSAEGDIYLFQAEPAPDVESPIKAVVEDTRTFTTIINEN